jgi:predicted amidohydrolase
VRLPVALVQLNATADVGANIAAAAALADEGAAGGARLIALPEYLQYRGPDEGFRASARPIPGPHTDPFADVARRHGAWVLVGTMAETSPDPGRPYNTSTLIAPDGSIAATYRKLHLFDVTVDDGPTDTESARVTAGDQIVTADIDGVRLGLTICYDLRFPELYRRLTFADGQRPCDLLAVPAAFTYTTGRAHWELLLRARAVENQCYVIAPAQGGTHETGRRTWGHSMIVDPWGEVLNMLTRRNLLYRVVSQPDARLNLTKASTPACLATIVMRFIWAFTPNRVPSSNVVVALLNVTTS